MNILQNLPPAVTLVLALLLLVWLVLLLLVPFMIESIRGSARKAYLELEELNAKLDRLIVLLDQRDRDTAMKIDTLRSDLGPRVEDRPSRERPERVRKEPTISG
jgi:hypothetical protein